MTDVEPDFITRPFKKKAKAEPAKPSAEIVPLPTGEELALKKAERTRASAYDRALEAERLREEERARRAEAYLNSPAYQAAGERFNREQARLRDENWFDPRFPGGFRP